MPKAACAALKDDLSSYVKKSVRDEVLIPRRGKPATNLIGFDHEDDWLQHAYAMSNVARAFPVFQE